MKVDAGVSAQNGSNMTLSKSKGGIKEEVCLNDVIEASTAAVENQTNLTLAHSTH